MRAVDQELLQEREPQPQNCAGKNLFFHSALPKKPSDKLTKSCNSQQQSSRLFLPST
jgi:hypothetical protein